MRKFLIFIALFLLMGNFVAYPFWIWSPKTQKWKNPKYSALATPFLQYKAALKAFEADRYPEALKEFRKLLIYYPDAKEAAESQYYLGRCLEKLDKPYEAFLAYQKIIDSYPNSQRINEVIERQYNIGEYFLNREQKKVLGMSLYDFLEHPAIQIFSSLVNKAPYSEYAPRAQYKLGIILLELGRFDEARDAFGKVVDSYSDTEWAAPAKYQLAIATSKAFPGADYDSTYLKEATSRLDEFIQEHPEVQISDQAQDQLKALKNREAKKNFEIAQFYESQGQYKSAVIYYRKVVDDYLESDYYNGSLEKVQELSKLAEGDLAKKELTVSRKKEAAQKNKAEKISLKKRKRQQKQDISQKRIEYKKELRNEAKEAKQLRKEQKLAKRARILADKEAKKLAREAQAKAKKETIRQEKLKAKEQRIKEEVAHKAQARAKKETVLKEKLEKKKKRVQEKEELNRCRLKAKQEKKNAVRAKKEAAKRRKLQKVLPGEAGCLNL